MNNAPYHHGGLRTAMIEKGIEMINEHGVTTLSLRKLAKACGVTHPALYSHFANKDELLKAIQNHITEQFVTVLAEAMKESGESIEGLFHMGCSYVLFFVRNPQYFSFTFAHMNIHIDFIENRDAYEPFVLYKNFMTRLFDRMNYPKEKQINTLITHWVFVHGLASVATMSGSGSVEEWEKRVPDLLANSYFLGGEQC